jgi:hypothetical protein
MYAVLEAIVHYVRRHKLMMFFSANQFCLTRGLDLVFRISLRDILRDILPLRSLSFCPEQPEPLELSSFERHVRPSLDFVEKQQ